MSIRVSEICKEMKERFGDEIKFMNELSVIQKLEHGANVCENREVSLGTKCVGKQCAIPLRFKRRTQALPPCKEGEKHVGFIHTHPGPAVLSPPDIGYAERNDMEFACAVDDRNNLKCVETPKGTYMRYTAIYDYAKKSTEFGKCWNKEMQRQPLASVKTARGVIPHELEQTLVEKCLEPIIDKHLRRKNLKFCKLKL